MAMAKSEPALLSPVNALRKKQSRLNRMSSFFPSLITSKPIESPTGHSVHRKPIPDESPILDRPPVNHGQSWLDPLSSDSPHLGDILLLDPSERQRPTSDSTLGNMKLQKQPPKHSHPPPAPSKTAPPVPPKTSGVDSTPRGSSFQFNETKPSPKLTKRNSSQRPRSNSVQHESYKKAPQQQAGLAPRYPSVSPEPRGRSSSAQAPTSRIGSAPENRPISAAVAMVGSRPGSSNGSQSPTRDGEKRGRLRRSWLPGNRSRSTSQDIRGGPGSAAAWTLGQTKADYSTSFLANGERVPELWNENGNVLVYLHPKGSGLGASFKVPSFVTDYSLVFNDLIEAELTTPSSSRSRARSFTGRDSLSVADAERRLTQSPPTSPPGTATPGESKLYFPASLLMPSQAGMDLERLISIRNMFAFLTGQPLVGTKAQPTLFAVLMRISSLFSEFEFTNIDGSTFGDAVEMSFSFFMDQMAVADVRHSREKTLEALVLGERMRSWDLYSEAFAHAVGKYSAIRDLNSPLWDQVSSHTRQRLERGHLDLLTRQNSVNNRLESFEFPSLFAGVGNSTTMYRNVKFNVWRKSFGRMRSFVLGYYKSNFGSWPPKARSKKNPFSESGLNRQVLKILYSDLCALYDLLVDREAITPRVIDQTADEITEDDDGANPNISALRKILGEFDHSSPPVLPPIPFDVPKLPDMTSIKENYYQLPLKEKHRLDRNVQDYEFLLIMNKSYDFETMKLKLPFLEDFKEFELKEAKGKSISELADQRIGYWLFLYVVIQSLPMLVVDAPGLKFTEGVEYFLCQPPKGHAPWQGAAPEVRKRWYEVSGGTGYVELSEDAVQYSVEGIYHRSHCWLAAKSWASGDRGPVQPQERLSPLQAPQSVFTDMDPSLPQSPKIDTSGSPFPPGASSQLAMRSRNASPVSRQAYRSSIALGLEPVDMPQEPPNQRGSRVFSSRDSLPASRPASMLMGRSRSSGNLHAMSIGAAGGAAGGGTVGGGSGAHSRSSSRQDSQGPGSGSTFDDILKDINNKPKKKKTFFGGS